MEETQLIERRFFCEILKEQIKVKIPKDLAENHKHFPFSYLFLHGPVDDILTTIYLDANLNIRGTESVQLNESENNVFSKEQAILIVKNITSAYSKLQEDYNNLLDKYEKLQGK